VYFGLLALSPAPPPTVAVLAAARDLTGGVTPARDDLRTVDLPAGAVPTGALRPGSELTSRVLSGPVRAGEPLTDARFLAPPAVPSGSVAYPFRVDDADVTALLRVGDRITLYAAASTTADAATVLARAVPVVAAGASIDHLGSADRGRRRAGGGRPASSGRGQRTHHCRADAGHELITRRICHGTMCHDAARSLALTNLQP